jgi:WD40 repeat protein
VLSPTPTLTRTPTATPSPSASPTITPTPTLALPVTEKTPWPTPGEAISVANIDRVVELAKLSPWGSYNLYVNQILWPLNERLLAAAFTYSLYYVYDHSLESSQGTLQRAQAVNILPGFAANGDRFIHISRAHHIQIWGVQDWELLEEWEDPNGGASQVALSPDGEQAAIASYSGVIALRQADGVYLRTFSRLSYNIERLVFSPDGVSLACGSDEPSVRLWQVSNGSLQHLLRGHTDTVRVVAFSSDGRLLASGSADDSVMIWDLSTGDLLHTLEGHTQDVFGLAFSPDGEILASGSGDNTIILWRVSSGERLRTLEGPTSIVKSLIFSPDGRHLASGSNDSMLRIWGIGP